MKKYTNVFVMTLQSELTYKANLIVWRLRNVLSLIVVYFLWTNIFPSDEVVMFGYDRSKILTYIFCVVAIKAIVLSSKSTDIAGEIGRGDLSNYLVKPVSYFRYWFTKDMASKFLNVVCMIFEISILFLILKPDFYFQTDPLYLIVFLITLTSAILIYFLLVLIVSCITFWAPELGWGSHFLITVILVDFLSGAIFPLDVLPDAVHKIILSTPFPYMLYFPIQVYLGKVSLSTALVGTAISFIWTMILYLFLKNVWAKGIKVYEAYGR